MTSPVVPGDPRGWDDLTSALRALRAHAGSPSFAQLVQRVERVRAARGVPAGERRPGRVTVYDVFRDGRARLDVELVADVVRALGGGEDDVRAWRAAHAAVAGRAADARPAASPAAAPRTTLRPLPDEPAALTGRAAEVDALTTAWDAGRVAVVTGMPGVGKSALAHGAARTWAAGTSRPVLVVPTPGDGVEARDLLADLVAAPGASSAGASSAGAVPTGAQPAEVRTGDATPVPRGLLLVEDVPDADVVTAVADAASGWALVVTSRRALPEVAGVHVRVEPLPPDAAVALIAAVAGPERVAAEPDAARRVATACEGLPLALVVAAGRIAGQESWSLADHARRIEASAHALPALDTAYDALAPDEARVLRRVALVPAPLPPVCVALLVGADERSVRDVLSGLDDVHLVRTGADGAVHLHALVRRYARERADAVDAHSDVVAAVGRLGAWLAERAAARVAVVAPHAADTPATRDEAADDAVVAAAHAWLETHRAVCVAAAPLAADLGLTDVAQGLSDALGPWFDMVARWRDALVVHGAAATGGDPAAVARACRDLGRAHERLGHYDEALAQLVRAAESGHDARPGQTFNRVGNVEKRLGRLDAAAAAYARAEDAARHGGDAVSEGRAIGNRADTLRLLGRYDEACDGYARALALSERVGDRNNAGIVRLNHATLLETLGDLPRARTVLGAALDDARAMGDASLEAAVRTALASVDLTAGDPHAAVAQVRAALAGRADLEAAVGAEARALLGRALVATGDVDAGRRELLAALAAGRAARVLLVQGTAAHALGTLDLAAGRADDAEAWFAFALDVGTRIGVAADVTAARDGLAAVAALRGGGAGAEPSA
ncbi:tetratricopeptide repeat protein [Cellulomonas sp. HD19AZ1]|uniref:tetratricopeptide repeat protein n=1 Tax=Cellulomonas TaxID=1707 RepID=UPI001071352B|nr:tetratricopeptide repeat protein [Cellulomonas sp. HD19AZ1]TFH71275.1 tetratricopeptide repeat protein [Cellulomonas sp. HD19AZ1]